MVTRRTSSLCLLALVTLMLFASHTAHAETDGLREAVRAELLKDPRASGIAPADFEALVDALTGEAAAQNWTAADLTFAEQPAPENVSEPQAETSPTWTTILLLALAAAASLGALLFARKLKF